MLEKAFEKLDIKKLDPLGEPFDPARHEAVMAQEAANAEPNSVLQVLQPGYELNGRLLRPGAAGLAALVEPIPFLAALAERGVRAAAFEGEAASRATA